MLVRVVIATCCLFLLVVSANDCDRSILPELTFRMSGNNLQWPCQSTKNIYITSGRYMSKNVIATRTQIYKDEALLALPRLKPGSPFTLGRISLRKSGYSSAISPWPCWSIQEEGNCEALQSVVDLYLDPQEILWVLDVGVVNTLTQPVRRCQPKVVGICVKTGKVVKVIDLSDIVTPQSRLQYLVVDYDKDGNSYIYIADAGSVAIIVHDNTLNKLHRIVLPTAVITGTCKSDILYIVLVRKSCGTNVLYFTYLGATRLFSIKTEHLRRGQGSGAVIDVGAKPDGVPLVLLGTDNGAALLVRQKGESDIYMWNTETCFKSSNFIQVQKGGDCRLATHVVPGHRRFLWALESNFHDYAANTVGCNGPSIVLHPVVKECTD